MSITDELREYAEKNECKSYCKLLTAIADRIDAEHEAALLNVHIDLMDASGWVRLPKDADGEYIRIGDVMNSKVDYLFDGKPFTVRGLVLCEDGWEAADGCFGNRYEPDSLHHYHAPTVEDVLREFGTKADPGSGYWATSDEFEVMVAEYAAKLQLREDA